MRKIFTVIFLILLALPSLNAGGHLQIGVTKINERLSVHVKKFEEREIIFLMIDGEVISSASFKGGKVYFEAQAKSPCISSLEYNKKNEDLDIKIYLRSAKLHDENVTIRRTGEYKYEWREDERSQ